MMQTVEPAKNQIFCKPVEAATKTSSGFFLPDSSKENTKIAEVINVGEGVTYKAKDNIIYKAYAVTEFKLNRETYYLLDVDDVLGKVISVIE